MLPRLTEPLESGSTAEVPVFVSVYPKGEGPVELSASLRSGEDLVAEVRAALPVADGSGRVNWVARIPSAGLRPGDYEVVVTARQATLHAEGKTPLRVVPGGSALAQAVEPRAPTPEASLVPILERATRYVVGYEESFRNVVAEETYSQSVFVGIPLVTGLVPGVPSAPGLKPTTPALLLDKSYWRRKTRADLVFVRLPGDVPWSLFRDVFEVDGRKVRDRDRRLQMLFQHPSSSGLTQARRIVEESARYNIGGAARTINVPTMPLVFLHPRNQSRFSFVKGGQCWISGVEALEIRFEEVARPTVVTTSSGDSLPAHGSFWIDPSRGAVLRSEVVFRFEPSLAEAWIETNYKLQPSLRLWVPVEMKERYRNVPRLACSGPTARYSSGISVNRIKARGRSLERPSLQCWTGRREQRLPYRDPLQAGRARTRDDGRPGCAGARRLTAVQIRDLAGPRESAQRRAGKAPGVSGPFSGQPSRRRTSAGRPSSAGRPGSGPRELEPTQLRAAEEGARPPGERPAARLERRLQLPSAPRASRARPGSSRRRPGSTPRGARSSPRARRRCRRPAVACGRVSLPHRAFGCSNRSRGLRNDSLATSRFPTKTCPSRSSTSGPRAGVPAEVVADRAPLVALEGGHGVDERVVVDAHVRAVEDPHAPVAAHEHVAGDGRSPRDLEEEADRARSRPSCSRRRRRGCRRPTRRRSSGGCRSPGCRGR